VLFALALVLSFSLVPAVVSANPDNGDINITVVDMNGTPVPGSQGAKAKLWGWDSGAGAWAVFDIKDADENGVVTYTAAEIAAKITGAYHFNINTWGIPDNTAACSRTDKPDGFWSQFIDYDTGVEYNYSILTATSGGEGVGVTWNGANSKLEYSVDLGDRDDSSADWLSDFLSIEKKNASTPDNPDCIGSTYGTNIVFPAGWLEAEGYTVDDGGAANGDYCYLHLTRASDGYDETFLAEKSTDGLTYTVPLVEYTKQEGPKEDGSYNKDTNTYTLTFDPTSVFDPCNAWNTGIFYDGPGMKDGSKYYAVLRVRLKDTPAAGLNTMVTPGAATTVFDPIEGPVVNANTGAHYYSIQSAIDDALADDTITCAAGAYNEHVIVDRALTLSGANAGIPGTGTRGAESIIDADYDGGWDDDGITIASGGVTVDGFKIIEADDPIIAMFSASTDNMTNIIIKNNYIDNAAGATRTSGTEGICFIAMDEHYSADGAVIKDNYVKPSQDTNAISLDGLTGAFTVEGNTIEDARNGLWLSALPNNFQWYGRVSLTGTEIKDNIIQDLRCSWSTGIGLSYVDGDINITGNTVACNVSDSIGLQSGSSWHETNYHAGSYATGLNIVGNDIYNNGWAGVYLIDGSDDISIHWNNIYNNGSYGVHGAGAASVVDAENNWWGADDGPGGVGPGSGDTVSANVDYDPWLGAGPTEVESETVTGDGTMEDTPTGGDVSIDATGEHTITTAKYEDNPGGTPTFEATGDYYDVHLDDDSGVNSLTIEFCPADEDTVIYYWDETSSSWKPCSNQSYSAGCIVVTVSDSTFPSLSDLSGLPFAPGTPYPPMAVGGEAYPVNKLGILAPWIGLALVIALGGGILVMRRRRAD